MKAGGFPFLIGCGGGGTGFRVAIADARGRSVAQGAAGPAIATSDRAIAARNVGGALVGAVFDREGRK